MVMGRERLRSGLQATPTRGNSEPGAVGILRSYLGMTIEFCCGMWMNPALAVGVILTFRASSFGPACEIRFDNKPSRNIQTESSRML